MKLLEPWTLIIILIIILIIFGPKQLPQLGKTLGKTMKSIREGAEGKDDELPDAAEAEAAKAEADEQEKKEPAAKS